MKDLTHLKMHIFCFADKTVSVDVYVDYAKLQAQAKKASESKSGESRDGALVVKVLRTQDVKR